MRVLDLFAGMRGWSKPFEDRGHEVYSVELFDKFEGITHRLDVIELAKNPSLLGDWKPDIILASPPCTTFSMMCVGKYWTHDNKPKNEKAAHALKMVESAISLIEHFNPRFFIIENPRAKLRKMPQMQRFERRTVTYCQYGEKRMKPTDLWGRFPESLSLLPMCKNGSPCHIPAPRGSTAGTQGMKSEESAKIPYQLSLQICISAENQMGA